MMEEVMRMIFGTLNGAWKWIGPLGVVFFGAWMLYCIVAFVCMFVDDVMIGGVDNERL